jgi:ubiquitin-protein ligase
VGQMLGWVILTYDFPPFHCLLANVFNLLSSNQVPTSDVFKNSFLAAHVALNMGYPHHPPPTFVALPSL